MGEVKGDIFAERKVVIHTNGKVHGDINSPNLVIDDGGIFNGRCPMQDVEQIDKEKVIMIGSQKMM